LVRCRSSSFSTSILMFEAMGSPKRRRPQAPQAERSYRLHSRVSQGIWQ
jgi:hypothetical protein